MFSRRCPHKGEANAPANLPTVLEHPGGWEVSFLKSWVAPYAFLTVEPFMWDPSSASTTTR